MSHYLCTTRSGLFLNFTKKIIKGAFFGLARDGQDWYIFGSKAHDRSKPTNDGYILKFVLDAYGNPVILEEFASDLDNGVHQIIVHDGYLYVLETYIQQIRKFCLRTKTSEIIYPLPRAIISWYKYHGMEGSLEHYAHMNALTVQDDRFYVSCPKLRNKLNEDGNPDQDRNPTLIRVFSKEWKLIDEIDTGRYFCHDLVIIGHDIYFADATNTICKVNSVTHEVSEVWTVDPLSSDLRKICRGLSISHDGKVIVGTHDFQGNSYVVDVLEKKQVKLEDTPCCIMKIDGTDYCDEQSPLRQSHVVSGFAKNITFINEIYEHLREVHPSHMIEGKHEKPPPIIFDPKLEDWKESPIYFDQKNTDSKKILKLNTVTLPKGFTESGPFYLYPQGGGMDWHTNMNNLTHDNGERYLRMYILTCTGDSYFLYRHPVSEKIHAIKDVDGQFIVFNLKYPNFKNFWHAVYTKNGSRLSYGMKFGKKQLFELGLPNLWNLSYEPPIVISGREVIHHHYATLSNVFDEHYLSWLIDKFIPSIYTFDVRQAKDFKKCSKVGWTDNKLVCTNLAEKIQRCNSELFGFKVENFSECTEYREFDKTYQNTSDWFMDVQEKHCERKLSAIMFLSDPSEYEGGELNMITSKGTVVVNENKKGSVIVFPSYLLYRFGPIKNGTLKILIGWAV
jgi:PKHD-type hydroxylase